MIKSENRSSPPKKKNTSYNLELSPDFSVSRLHANFEMNVSFFNFAQEQLEYDPNCNRIKMTEITDKFLRLQLNCKQFTSQDVQNYGNKHGIFFSQALGHLFIKQSQNSACLKNNQGWKLVINFKYEFSYIINNDILIIEIQTSTLQNGARTRALYFKTKCICFCL
jgi:hypothetical protein